MKRQNFLGMAICAAIGLMLASAGRAEAGVTVSVGYADDLRPSPFFPNPWAGSPGVSVFAGAPDGGYDTGAIMVQNTGSTSTTITNLVVDSFGDGASFAIWSSYIGTGIQLAPGGIAIFAQTSGENFDTSDDEGGNPLAIPVVHLTVDGTTLNLSDTAQVLNTEGTDHLGGNNLNESHAWRPIGTFGGQAGLITPEPATLLSAGFAVAAGLVYARSRRSSVA